MIGFGLHGRHWASSHLNMVNPSEPGRSRFRVSLADVGPFHAPGIAGSVHWRQHEEKKHQPNEMCKKQTSPFRCAFRTHTGASWANDHELSIIIYLLVGFHGGSLLLIHPVLYRTSSGYGAPSVWPLRCLGPNSVMPKSQSFALSSASSTTFARRRRGADFRSTHPSFEVVKAIFLYVPSGYLFHSHGIDGPFIDGLPI